MRTIHEVLIIPAYGHHGTDGWSAGHTCGRWHEIDLVDRYVAAICDALDMERIRFKVLPTREHPGLSDTARAEAIEPMQLVLDCRIGFDKRKVPVVTNGSKVWFGPDTSTRLARMMTEALGEWGRCHIHSHQIRNPQRVVAEKLLAASSGLRIEPFAINAPGVEEYAKRSDALGRSIAWALKEYLNGRAHTGHPFRGIGTDAAPAKTQEPSWSGLPEWLLRPIGL